MKSIALRVAIRLTQATAAAAGCLLGVLGLALIAPVWRPPSPPPPQAPQSGTRAVVLHRVPSPPLPPRPPKSIKSQEPAWNPVYGQTSYTVITNAVPPVKVKDVRPVYPPIAVSHDVQGVVVVQATITGSGRVADARIVKPAGLLNQAALDAVKLWEFEPAAGGGTVGRNLLTVRVSFTRQ
jgi:TonB family protein